MKLTHRQQFYKDYWFKFPTERSVVRAARRHNKRKKEGKYDIDGLKSARNSLFKKSLKRNATKAEMLVGDWLWNNKEYFIFQKGFFDPFHRIADFFLPDYALIIEVDGSSQDETKLKDTFKDERWERERNIKTLRITNEQVYAGDFPEMFKKIIS
jgi:very-short-patch-repair endonuclease